MKSKTLLYVLTSLLCFSLVGSIVFASDPDAGGAGGRPYEQKAHKKLVDSKNSVLHMAVKDYPIESVRRVLDNLHVNPLYDDVTATIVATPYPVENPLVNALDANLATPLHLAAIRGTFDVVKLLIERGALLDAQDKFGNTPLHYAVFYGHPRTVCFLCESGANLELLNSEGQSAADYVGFDRPRVRLALNKYLQKSGE